MNSSPEPTDLSSHGILKTCTPSSVRDSSSTINSMVQRYSRSSLYLLRNEARSRRRPDAALRSELISLGVWRASGQSGSYHQNGNEVSVSSANSGNNHTITPHTNTRPQRSPSTRTITSSNEHILSSHYVHPNQKNYLDQRSISSAHLMPAFAKRRIGVSSLTATPFTGSASTVRSETPNELNQTRNEITYPTKQRGKEHLQDRQRTDEASFTTFLSPQRKKRTDYDKERSDHSEINNSDSISPAPSGISNSRHIQSCSGNERRIGSGRLLHCDVNWDYRSPDNENQRSTHTSDKEAASHNQQQRICGRYLERGTDRSIYIEKRSFDRRSNEDSREKFESRNSALSSSSRRMLSNDMDNNSGQSSEHRPVQHTRNRRHHYNDRNDEPEWFSGGPTSQHDTIELRGFDEIDDQYSINNKHAQKKLTGSSSSLASSVLNLSNSKSNDSKLANEKDNESISDFTTVSIENGRTESMPNEVIEQQIETQNISEQNSNDVDVDLNAEENINSQLAEDRKMENDCSKMGFTDFSFDAFLSMDPLNHSLMGGDVKPHEIVGNSRFSRWFMNKNNKSDAHNTPSVESKINEVQQSNGNESEFGGSINRIESQNTTLMQFLQRSGLPPAFQDNLQPHVGIPSVEELEARMRRNRLTTVNSEACECKEEYQKTGFVKHMALETQDAIDTNLSPVSTTPQDTEAFKKILEQLGSANKQEKDETNIQQDQQPLKSATTINILQAGHSLPPNLSKNEEISKFIQQQQFIQHHPQQLQIQQNQPHPILQPVLTAQKRLEAQNLLQCLSRGDIKVGFLEQELNNPNMSSFSKEIIAAALNEHSNNGTPSNIVHSGQHTANSISHSHNLLSPKTVGKLSSVQQQGMQKHGILQNSHISTSSVIQPVQQQGTSAGPRDIQFHTQNIIRNVIMKKKLDEQESLRRRQDIQKLHSLEVDITQKNHQLQASSGLQIQQQAPQSIQTSPHQHHTHPSHHQYQQRHINSPTPLAFTPTSVLRKMTAEKDSSSVVNIQQSHPISQIQTSASIPSQLQQQHHQLTHKNMQAVFINQHHQQQQLQQHLIQQHQQQQSQVLNINATTQMQTPQQPRMILGGGSHPQNVQMNGQPMGSQSLGSNSLQQNTVGIHTSQQTQKLRTNNQIKWSGPALNQQQQLQVNKPIGRPILKGPIPSVQQIQQKHKINPTMQHVSQQPFTMAQQQSSQNNVISNVQQHLFQQQHRSALHRAQHTQIQQLHQQPSQQLTRSSGIIGSNQQQPVSTNITTGNSVIINYQRDGGLSPTSNQLAQWFSPELLAQASAGKLPLLNMNQALSLEEFERSIQHSSTAVHN